MSATGAVAAVDLGATSGRVMLARVGPGRIAMRQVSRFANDPLPLWQGDRAALHWDLPGLYRQVGFTDIAQPAQYMERHDPQVYRRTAQPRPG